MRMLAGYLRSLAWSCNSRRWRSWREGRVDLCLAEHRTACPAESDTCDACLALHVEDASRQLLFEVDRLQGKGRSSRYKPKLPAPYPLSRRTR